MKEPNKTPVQLTADQKAEIAKRGQMIKAATEALLAKFPDKGIKVEPGNQGKLKITASFMRAGIMYTYIRQIEPARLGEVEAHLQGEIDKKPEDIKAAQAAAKTVTFPNTVSKKAAAKKKVIPPGAAGAANS